MKQFLLSNLLVFSYLILSLFFIQHRVEAQTPLTTTEWSGYVDANPNGNFGNIPSANGLVFSQWRRYNCTHESAADGYNSRGMNGNPVGNLRTFIKTNANTSFYIDSIRMNVRKSNTGPATFSVYYMQYSSGIYTFMGAYALPNTNNLSFSIPANICVPANDSIVISVLVSSNSAGGTFRMRNGTAIYGRTYTQALPNVVVDIPAFVCAGEDAVVDFLGTPNATVVYNTDGFTPQFLVLNSLGEASLVLPAVTSPLTVNVTNIGTTPCLSQNLSITGTILVNPSIPPTNINETICAGANFVLGSSTYTTAGLYSDTLTATTGCDSIVNLNLTVNPLIVNNLSETICAGASFIVGTSIYNTTGLYSDTFITAGCDSIVNLNLTVNPLIVNNLTETICAGASFIVGTSVYTTTGLYSDTFTGTSGCDSMVNLNLTVNPLIENNLIETICAGASFIVGTSTYTTTGLYADTFTTASCDSIVNLNLTVNPMIVPLVTINTNTGNVICSGTLVTFTAMPVNGGAIPIYQWKKNGVNVGTNNVVYTDNTLVNGDVVTVIVTANANCVSTIPVTSNAITMTVNAPIAFTQTIAICDLQLPYLWNGITVITGGVNAASVTLSSAAGCDSVVTLNLTVNSSTSATEQISICAFELPYLWYGNVITNSGMAVANTTFVNSVGCDSLVTLNLDVIPVVVPTISISVSPGTNVPPGTPLMFTAIIANGGTLPFFQWQKNGINVGGNGAVYIDFNVDSGDVISCHLQSSIPCANPVNVLSNEVEIVVEVPPAPCHAPIVLLATDIQMTSAIFKWTSVESAVGYEYALSMMPGNPSSVQFTTDTSYHALQLQSGTNYLHVRSKCDNGEFSPWIRMAITIQEAPTNTDDVNTVSEVLLLYPNPNNGNFNIKGKLAGKMAKVEVVDNAGRVIHSEQVFIRNGAFDHYLQLADKLSQGVYLLRVSTDQEISVVRFVHN